LVSDLPTGELVFFLGKNDVTSIMTYVALMRSNLCIVMINANLERHKLESFFASYQPRYIYGPADFLRSFQASKTIWSSQGYSLIEFEKKRKISLHPDLKMLLPTSGSTGNPSFVRLSSKNLESNSQSIAKYLDLNGRARAITTLPINYSYGISIINSHLTVGGSIYLNESSVLSREFWRNLGRSGATHFAGVPFTYESLRNFRADLMKSPTLRVFTQAGGRLSPDIINEYAIDCSKAGKLFYVMYGQTEATARISYLPPEMAASLPGSVGIPIPGGSIELRDESGKVIDEFDTPGELIYKGENVSLGYAKSIEDLSLGDENMGVLKTGDIAVRSDSGYLYIVGRKNRIAKIFGIRINLLDLESYFRDLGHEIVAIEIKGVLCVANLQANIETGVLRNSIAEYLDIHKSGIEVRLFDFVPRNESGKIRYAELEKIWNSFL
jgi:long-chain acyl-CoA synthetase